MRSRFITDPQDPFDSFLNTAWDEFHANFFPAPPSNSGGNPSAGTSEPVEILATPALTSEAVQSSSAQSGPTTVTALTTGGITINLLFDAAAMAAPASFRAGIQQAASILTSAISDKITINIKIDYSGTGGGAAAGPDAGLYESYTSVRADLINNATPGDTTFNALPGGSSIQGQANVAVWNAQLKLWGILGANDTTTDDGSATFATDINSGLLVGVALHELTHAMGRVPYGSAPDIFDLFRFTSAGTRLFSGGATAPASYFSVDGGNTKLADFGQTSDPSDFLSSGVQGPNDPFNEFYSGSTSQSLTTVDKEILDTLGFHMAAPVSTTVIESFGSTKLVQVGNNYYLDSISAGSGPELKFAGAAVVAGQFGGGWAPIGAEQTASGYDVAWKVTGADQYTVWFTDSSGNHVSNTPVLSGTSPTLESLETTFHQDLNGDGVIGIPTNVIEAFGSTSLTQVGSNFYLYNSGGSGPELEFSGAAVVAGEFGVWTSIGAEQTPSGYDVAWKVTGADQYTVWFTDSSGNHVSNTPVLSGTSPTLESLETTFHQDLNGDGYIGLVINAGAILELPGAESGAVTFTNSTGTLKMDAPSTFNGQIVGFTGDGTLSGSDQIDLLNINYSNSIQTNSTYNSSTGVLSVSNGSTVDLLHFIGSYSQANFKFASDGQGGTIVYDPPATSQPISEDGTVDTTVHVTGNSTINGSSGLNGSHLIIIVDSGATLTLDNVTAAGNTITNNGTVKVVDNSTVSLSAGAGKDNFVFAPDFGQATISHFTPGIDTLQIDHAVFATMDALLAATHDDSHGNAVITDAAHDTITIQNITTAQLLAHQGDFHLV